MIVLYIISIYYKWGMFQWWGCDCADNHSIFWSTGKNKSENRGDDDDNCGDGDGDGDADDAADDDDDDDDDDDGNYYYYHYIIVILFFVCVFLFLFLWLIITITIIVVTVVRIGWMMVIWMAKQLVPHGPCWMDSFAETLSLVSSWKIWSAYQPLGSHHLPSSMSWAWPRPGPLPIHRSFRFPMKCGVGHGFSMGPMARWRSHSHALIFSLQGIGITNLRCRLKPRGTITSCS